MRIMLKKDIKLDKGEILYKNSEGTLIGVSWGDAYNGDTYHVEIKNKRYLIDRKDCEIYGEKV